MSCKHVVDEYGALVAIQQIRSRAERLREVLLSPELAGLRRRLGAGNINVDLSQILNVVRAYEDEVIEHLDDTR